MAEWSRSEQKVCIRVKPCMPEKQRSRPVRPCRRMVSDTCAYLLRGIVGKQHTFIWRHPQMDSSGLERAVASLPSPASACTVPSTAAGPKEQSWPPWLPTQACP